MPASVLASTTGNIAIVSVVLISLGWVVYGLFNVVAGRKEVGSEIELAANRKEYYDDETLEGSRLERVQLFGVLLLVVIVISLPLYWVFEPSRQAGAEVSFFSPLGDGAPDAAADAVYLPGGYPELHAGRLANSHVFLAGLKAAAARGAVVYGECGGYMVLGDGLTDAAGNRHEMLGLLRLETSFANRKLHLGYRRLTALAGPFDGALMGHEFHYATTLRADGRPLYRTTDAEGTALPDMGLVEGRVSGSFAHVIDRAS